MMHDGKCRHPEKRPMGDGVPYRRSICFVGNCGAREGCGAGENSSSCVPEGPSGVVRALNTLQFWQTLGIKGSIYKLGGKNQVSFVVIFRHFPRNS